MARKTTQARFDSKVKKTATCWLWTACLDCDGYGRFQLNGRPQLAHRVAWWLKYNKWPKILRHTCDNPACVNLDHLVDGTHASNAADRVAKGRSAIGTDHGRAKLTEANVKEIRKSKETTAALARRYGVNFMTIRPARKRQTWKHVI